VAACALVFAGHLLFGANTDVSALAIATLWLILGGVVLFATDRRVLPPPTALMILAGVCFLGVLATGASQLLPAGGDSPLPLWSAVDGASAWTLDRDATRRELVKLVSLAAAFSVGFIVGASDRRTRFLVFLAVIASGVYAAWAFTQHFISPGTVFGVAKPYHLDRLTGSFLSANSAATALGLMAVIAAARIARAVKESAAPQNVSSSMVDQLARRGGAPALVLLLLATCIVETQSRAGIVATAAALMILVAWEVRDATAQKSGARRGANAAIAAAGVLAVLTLLEAGETAERLGATAADAGSRLIVFEAHWRAILESPWRGFGLGSFTAINDYIQTPENYVALGQLNALHNVYLQWLEEAGVVGASLMFACIALLLANIWRGLVVRASMLTWLRAVLAASLLVLVHGLVDYALQVPSIAWMWALLLGVGCGVAAPRPREAEPNPERD
jgi:O-antigen ligase